MRRKKLFSLVLAGVVTVGLLSGCGSSGSGSESSTGDSGSSNTGETYSWKMALNGSEGENAYDVGAAFKEKIEELTDGQVEITLYGGGSLGATSEILEGMSSGVADLTVESVGTLASFTELANIDAAPYLFSGYDHFMNVWNSDLGQEMRDEIGEAAGFKLSGVTYRGARIVTATKAMSTIDDFKGFKLRTPSLDIYLDTWEWMGATPTPMSFSEVYTALQQGTIEGQENAIVDCLSYSLDDVCDYFILTNHAYSCNTIIMDLSYYESLPEDIQDAYQEAADYATNLVSEQQLANDETDVQEVMDKGIEVIEVDTDEFAAYFDGFLEEKFPDLADWAEQIKAMDE